MEVERRPFDYREPDSDQQSEFLTLMREKTGVYLEHTLDAMGLTWTRFSDMFRSIGRVRAVYAGDVMAGFVWIELRDRILHIHGLVIEPELRGAGIGTAILCDLESEYQGRVDVIELGAHASNRRARRLYERMGYAIEETLPDVGFFILRKHLARETATDPLPR